MNRLGPEQMNVETAPNVPSAEKPPEWQRRIREVGPVGLLVIGLGLTLMSSRWLGTPSEGPTRTDVQIRVVRTTPTKHPSPPVELGQPVTVTVRPVHEAQAALPRSPASEDIVMPPLTESELSATEPSLPDTLASFSVDGHEVTIHPKVSGNPLASGMGRKEIAVAIDGHDDHLLLDTDRASSIDVPGNALVNWDGTKLELELIYVNARLIYHWDGHEMALSDVNYLDPSEDHLLADLNPSERHQRALELLRGTETRHKRCEQSARTFVECLQAGDWDRITDDYRTSHPSAKPKDIEEYIAQQQTFLEKYAIDPGSLVFDPTFIYPGYYPNFVLEPDLAHRVVVQATPTEAYLSRGQI